MLERLLPYWIGHEPVGDRQPIFPHVKVGVVHEVYEEKLLLLAAINFEFFLSQGSLLLSLAAINFKFFPLVVITPVN